MTRRTIPFEFDNGRGQKLSGLIDMPEKEPLFYGVFAPCFTCTKEAHAAHKICRRLSERGVAVMRFDMTGLGRSEGDFADTNFTTRTGDIIAAVDAFSESHGAVSLLMGHSISGTAALKAVRALPGISVLATLGSPSDPLYVIDKFRHNGQLTVTGNDYDDLIVAGRKMPIHKSFAADMESHNVAADTVAYDRRLLIFHAPQDEIVGFDNALTIYGRATCDKELLSLRDDATHLLERGDTDADFIADVLKDSLAVS